MACNYRQSHMNIYITWIGSDVHTYDANCACWFRFLKLSGFQTSETRVKIGRSCSGSLHNLWLAGDKGWVAMFFAKSGFPIKSESMSGWVYRWPTEVIGLKFCSYNWLPFSDPPPPQKKKRKGEGVVLIAGVLSLVYGETFLGTGASIVTL